MPTARGSDSLETHRDVGAGPAQLETAEIGRYAILRELGAGGMGVVYAAYDPRLDRRIAIKVLRGADSGAGQERLEREAQAMAKVSHPNVVPVFDVGRHRGEVFISMEYIEGKSLNEVLAAEADWRVRLSLLLEAAKGLVAAHAAGLVHGDFKPQNVLVGDDGRVRVMDFGLARGSGASSDTAETTLPDARGEDFAVTRGRYGTPTYMAPEQFKGEFASEQSDQFSLCVSIYQALHGKRPFRGRSSQELEDNVTSGRIDPGSRNSKVPDWLDRVVARGLAVDPPRRWHSVEALLDAMGRDPTRRRRRILVATVVAFSTLAVGAGWATHAALQRAECEEIGSDVDRTWNGEQRGRVLGAMRGNDAPNADELADAVTGPLDAYVASWSSTLEAACVATQIDQTLTGELAVQSQACLRESRVAFDRAVEFIEGSDALQIQHAVGLAFGLPSVEDCVAPARLHERAPLGTDRSASDELRKAMTIGEVARGGGEPDQAATVVRAAIKKYGESVDPRLRARARYAVGVAEAENGNPEIAVEELVTALQLAIEHREDRTVVDVATKLAFVIGSDRGDVEQGRHWAEIAGAHLTLLTDDVLREAALENAHGAIFARAGDFEQSRIHMQRGLDGRAHALGERHPTTLVSRANVGMLNGILGDQEAAKDAFDQVVAATVAIYGRSHPLVATALEGLGGSELDAGRAEDGKGHYERALAIRRRVQGPDHPDSVNALVMLASAEGNLGEREAAITHLRDATEAQARVLGAEHPDLAAGLANLGTLLLRGGELDQAREVLGRSIAIHRNLAPEGTINLGIALNSLGTLEREAENYPRALEVLADAAAVLEARGGASHPMLAMPLMGRGRTFLAMQRFPEARTELERALEIRKAEPGNDGAQAQAQFHLATALWGLGETTKAEALARAALAVLEETPELESEGVAMVRAWLDEHTPTVVPSIAEESNP